MSSEKIGLKIYNLAKEIWSYPRSLTGKGNVKTLQRFAKICPNLNIKYVRSGQKFYDWKIPNEWNVKEAYIIDPNGKKICDFSKNNLHLVGYSTPIDKFISLKDLKPHLHTLKNQKNAIPYVTSYYLKNWGFCLSQNQKNKLKEGKYRVKINSTLKEGKLHYGEILIKGKIKKEIFLSTYICHPSLANNEISGMTLGIFLSNWINKLKNKRYSYRIIFIPETIGSIMYISKNLKKLKKNVDAGFNITCVGDERSYSYLPSKYGNTLSDKIILHVLKYGVKKFNKYKWVDRGGDERQYCSAGVDLPVATLMRTKYGEYKEYHTSLDKLGTVVTAKGLGESFNIYTKIIEALENNDELKFKIFCEPFLSKRNIYPTIHDAPNSEIMITADMLRHILSYADGNNDLIDIANLLYFPIWKLYPYIEILKKNKLIK